MQEDANIMNVVKHSLIAKACRGRYINVRGLLRDIQLISDFDADAAWSRTSDIRKKRNIQEDKLGLEFINKLKPVTHQWKPSNEFPKEWEEYNEENQMNLDVVIHNMIAQDVKKALDEVGCDTFGGWKEREDGSQTISREMFVTPLINAVKELSEQNKELEKRIQELENKKE